MAEPLIAEDGVVNCATLFLQERRFLKNCSPMTLRSYDQAWDAFKFFLGDVKDGDSIRAALKNGVLALVSAGKLKPTSVNVYIRSMNAFIRWASDEEHIKTAIKPIPLLKKPTKIIPTLTETQVQHLVNFKPRWRKEHRVRAMALLVLDTGIRRSECLHLEVRDVDLENCIVTVRKGKGDRQRKVPISATGRKLLYRYIAQRGNLAR